MKLHIVIDVGCHECGVDSVAVGAYRTRAGALRAAKRCDARTGRWRDGGETIAQVFEVSVPKAGTP